MEEEDFNLGYNRRTPTPKVEPDTKEKPGHSMSDPSPPSSYSQISYQAPKGQTIHIFRGDITKLQVDAIVNAANERLQHAGGVAMAISKAAGPHLQRHCDQLMKQRTWKDLDVAEAVTTQGYNLSCSHIIHVVGPQWHHYSRHQKHLCADDLEKTFINALMEARNYNCSSVAVPAISSGIYGVPLEVVVEQMYNAVMTYVTKTKGHDPVKDIILVHLSEDTVSTIQRKFYQEVKVTQTAPLIAIPPETQRFMGNTVTSSNTSRDGGTTPQGPSRSKSRSGRGQRGHNGPKCWGNEGQIATHGAEGHYQGQRRGQSNICKCM